MKWLAMFLMIPSVVYADCKDPKITEVSVYLQNVTWKGSLEPSCLEGFQVCWKAGTSSSESCTTTAADVTSVMIRDADPCEHVDVHVTAIGKGKINNSTKIGTGDANPIVKHVRVQLPNVSWTGMFVPQCLMAFEVCWSHIRDNDPSCQKLPAEETSILINDARPCDYLTVDVTAIGKGNLNRSTNSGAGYSDPPKMSGITATQRSRDTTIFEWHSLSQYSCVENLFLWICDNSTQDRKTCFSTNMYESVTKLELYDFPVCREYYAYFCAQHREKCLLSSLRIYLDSANELTRAEVTNITHDTAVVQWSVSDVNFTCKTEKMRLCYQEKGNGASADCYSWEMNQEHSSDSTTITDLSACATYSAIISLSTSGKDSSRTLTFTTPMFGDVLNATVVNVTDTTAYIMWSFNTDKKDCEPDSMQVCYTAVGDDSSRMCRSLGTAVHSSVRLPNLSVCTSYDVKLTLLTTSSPKPTTTLKLTTLSTGQPVMQSMDASAVGTTVKVQWIPINASLQCVRFFNVSWYSSGDPRVTWQTLTSDSTSFKIYTSQGGQTYYVTVAAIFVDGTSEALFQHVVVPAKSDSPALFHPFAALNVLTLFSVFVIYRHC